MNLFSKKYIIALALLGTLSCLHSGCTKEQIAPPNQSTAFVKYYGHVGDQIGSDVKRTLDGGYILVGSTNSYSSESESDIFVVKTDSLGQELWSVALGKASGLYAGTQSDLINKYVRYDEKGIRVVELPDGSGYTVVGNRTYVSYPTEASTVPFNPEVKTKVVMYQLDAAGAATTIDGVELRANTAFTDKASDMKLDTTGGLIRYVVTGYTTNVNVGKPNHGPNDKTDVFTVLLDETFTSLWITLAFGFEGDDGGASVHVLPNAYLVTGTSTAQVAPNPFYTRLLSVTMDKANAVPLNTHFGGDQNYDMVGGSSIYDAANRRITITGSVSDGKNGIDAYIGNAVLYQLNESLNVVSTGTGNNFGFKYFRPTPSTSFPPATRNYYRPQYIALLPDNEGFIVSATHVKSDFEHNIAIMNFNENLELVEGWPYFFGYEDVSGGFATKEVAGAIITVSDNIAGTSQSLLKGYAFTGTFGVGTNDMMGLVKVNSNGTLNP